MILLSKYILTLEYEPILVLTTMKEMLALIQLLDVVAPIH